MKKYNELEKRAQRHAELKKQSLNGQVSEK